MRGEEKQKGERKNIPELVPKTFQQIQFQQKGEEGNGEEHQLLAKCRRSICIGCGKVEGTSSACPPGQTLKQIPEWRTTCQGDNCGPHDPGPFTHTEYPQSKQTATSFHISCHCDSVTNVSSNDQPDCPLVQTNPHKQQAVYVQQPAHPQVP